MDDSVDPETTATDDPAPDPDTSESWTSSVLPRTTTQVVIGVVALMFLAGAGGYFIGVGDGGLDAPAADSAEVGFLYDMSAHHQQAVVLSNIELANGSDPAVKSFAQEILASQSYEIGLMQMRLGDWGYDPADPPAEAMTWMGMGMPVESMPGMADAAELAAFRDAEGPEADALFIALMTDHHRGGVAMAEAAAAQAGDEWVVDTGHKMAVIQTSEIVEMNVVRDSLGLDPEPAGFTAAFGTDDSGASEGHDDMDMGETDMHEMDMESGTDAG